MRLHKTFRLCAMCAWLLPLSAVAFAEDQRLKQIKPSGVEFTVGLPGDPARILVYVPLGSVAMQVRSLDLVKDGIRYHISSFPKGAAGVLSPDANFALFCQSLQSLFNESPNSATLDRSASADADFRQYQLRIAGQPGVLRVYSGEAAFYAVFAIGADWSKPSVNQFLTSFKLGELRKAGFEKFEEVRNDDDIPPNPWQKLNFSRIDTIMLGILNDKATQLPLPSYPRGETGEGMVLVRVLTNEAGVVTSAIAVDGPAQFHAAATLASERARFKPTYFMKRPVKVSGVLIYAFKERA